jgi:hypothetical protein
MDEYESLSHSKWECKHHGLHTQGPKESALWAIAGASWGGLPDIGQAEGMSNTPAADARGKSVGVSAKKIANIFEIEPHLPLFERCREPPVAFKLSTTKTDPTANAAAIPTVASDPAT